MCLPSRVETAASDFRFESRDQSDFYTNFDNDPREGRHWENRLADHNYRRSDAPRCNLDREREREGLAFFRGR